MIRNVMMAAAVAQTGVMFAAAAAWPYLFIPAALGLVALVACIPPRDGAS